ncbi:efflux RND transporter periplasmic adaptor subunit [Legionella longbeachae]|uniref:Putative efflux protein n=2 Tax=Legionella longbeachae TaxID=450 RepID=D3HN25_LEGLN|nr:efflux RND transporter periplasmic adaptor subunit [Legionella longbeachae]EEZ96725.1 RND family efflux transporter MFP subunit [Legionella longbeachae D-4968]CBJ13875.1 putative efflux protein [Legionella longbeachae NSW150]HBD7397143.1 efflux RND transporter periplasmic adaptor subunit [Legionella pneumophila]QEY53107.1 efflux RND transporter periplasmic adaptor subunit [Legionella longbeachae]
MVLSMNFNRDSTSVRVVAIIAILFFIYLLTHLFSKSTVPAIPLPTVVVQKPKLEEMVEYVTQTGTMVAYNSVNLVARVEGYLDSIEFVDGTFIKKGKELFVIQPEPYFEQLRAAKATVAAQKAELAYDKSEYARQQRMYKQHATSLNEVEKWYAKTLEMAAEVDKAEADEINAAITYSYTHIFAPFNGRIGRHLVDVGNLVGHGEATNLATIEQIDPIYVYFNLNELDLIKLRAAARARGFKPKDINKVPVEISLQNETTFKYKATLDFVNTGLNASTGTMELRALLPNKDYVFVPGLFVKVRVAISEPKKQLTVPDTAILYDQIGSYLLTVDNNNVVVLKHVTLGSQEEGRHAVVKGLDPQDNVIVDGLQNATPGNKVQIQQPTTTNSNSEPSTNAGK